MILGIGTDLVLVSRIEAVLGRQGERFARRILTDAELERFRQHGQPARYLAKRFAAKEAVIKALGETSGASLKDIEILADDRGKPLVKLHGKARKRAQALGLAEIAVSLSHSREYAVAVASGERPE